MAKPIEVGKLGKRIAELYLKNKGYKILHTNWSYEKGLIDIVAQKLDILIFVEVKSRRTNFFGNPREYVDRQNQQMIVKTSLAYSKEFCPDCEVQFDVVSVTIDRDGVPDIIHTENAFTLHDYP